MTEARLTRVLHWTHGVRGLASGMAPQGGIARAIHAFEAMEALGGLVAATADPQYDRAKRLSPGTGGDPVALLAGARSLRFYLSLEPGQPFEVEATVVPDEGELALVQCEVRRANGERAARGELRFLVVPPVGEHLRDAHARDALRSSLGPTDW
ncbi:MAG TPA: hypothetical protein VFF73_17320 [Planctomycetota bacterium]|nr:hypothetical protein [Planctomycetota bacterium]